MQEILQFNQANIGNGIVCYQSNIFLIIRLLRYINIGLNTFEIINTKLI